MPTGMIGVNSVSSCKSFFLLCLFASSLIDLSSSLSAFRCPDDASSGGSLRTLLLLLHSAGSLQFMRVVAAVTGTSSDDLDSSGPTVLLLSPLFNPLHSGFVNIKMFPLEAVGDEL